jgi:hypothetical protein
VLLLTRREGRGGGIPDAAMVGKAGAYCHCGVVGRVGWAHRDAVVWIRMTGCHAAVARHA